jgi:Tol biopolymer transport system component
MDHVDGLDDFAPETDEHAPETGAVPSDPLDEFAIEPSSVAEAPFAASSVERGPQSSYAGSEPIVSVPLLQSLKTLLLSTWCWSPRWFAAGAAAAVLIALLPLLRSTSFEPASVPVREQQATALQGHPALPTMAAASTPASLANARGDQLPTTLGAPDRVAAHTTRNEERTIQLISDTAFSPAFASTASEIFYHSGNGAKSAIMRAETDESGTVLRVSNVTDDRSSNFHARPSPDGQRLAFDSDRDGERGIYVADANGQGVRRVSGPGFAAVPSWSPDGRRLAFVRSEEGRPRVWNIWIVELATGVSTRITSHRVGQPWGAAWFPDGTRIAYSHENRLIVRSLQGHDVRIFSSPMRGRLLRTPAVSPDGTHVIFQVHRDGAWMLDLFAGSMSRVLKDPSAEEFTWSPDGERVAYHSRRSGAWAVWVIEPRG